jgi:hypothetical protein
VPTVLRLEGLRVAIYPNDHRPAHVHVIGAGKEAVFVLNCPNGPVSLRESYEFDGGTLRGIAASLEKMLEKLCESWKTIHGDFR